MGITALAAAMWQGQEISGGDIHWLMIFAGIAAFSLLLQSLMSLGMAIGVARMQQKIGGELQELKGKLLPILDKKIVPLFDEKLVPLVEKTSVLVTELTPQVREIAARAAVISGHVEQISALVRDKAEEFGPTVSAANDTVREANATVQEANRRTLQQVERVNGMVTGVLDATAQVGRKIQAGINVPVREATGIVEGVKTAWHTFLRVNTKPKAPVYHAPSGTYEPSGTSAPGTDPFYADVYAKEKPDLEP